MEYEHWACSLLPERGRGEKGLPGDPVLAQRGRKEMNWRFGLLPCSQNAHAQKVLVRCAQSEETKPHS